MKIDLKTLSDAELVERFNQIAVEMGYDSDYYATRSYNRRLEQIMAIDEELFSRGKLAALLPGMQNEELWVQYFSAVFCRELVPAAWEATMERLAKENRGTIASQARASLDIVRRGHAVPRSQRRRRTEEP